MVPVALSMEIKPFLTSNSRSASAELYLRRLLNDTVMWYLGTGTILTCQSVEEWLSESFVV